MRNNFFVFFPFNYSKKENVNRNYLFLIILITSVLI